MKFLLLIALFLVTTSGSPSRYRRVLRQFTRDVITNVTWRAEYERQTAAAPSPDLRLDFDCDVSLTSRQVPSSVHKLQPGDIKVIAAMGDSITAGNGVDAGNPVEVFLEFRGEAWSIGCDKSHKEGVLTLSNTLKQYNSGLKGCSVGYGTEDSDNAWFNVAVPGAHAWDLPAEADMLIDRMKADSRIDYENDWKLVTLLIGANDLCDYCDDRELHGPSSVGDAVQAAVDKLHAAVPRMLVQLVPMADVTPVAHIKTGVFCRSIHLALCHCATNKDLEIEIPPIQDKYYEEMQDLATSGRYDTRDDFTVVVQPFMKDQDFVRKEDGKYDPSYIAPDCFHPNRRSHQGMSVLLWNNMFTPVGEKKVSVPNDDLLDLSYICPTKESPYIYTNKNSD